MPAGIEVYAQDGSNVLQIDDRHLNLFLRAKGTATTDAAPNPSYLYSTARGIQVAGVRATMPIIVVSCGFLCQCSPISLGNGNWSLNFSMNAQTGNSLEWWLFDILGNDEASTAGLQIYNAAAQLQYDAMKKPLRIVGVILNSPAGSATYAAGRKYAVCLSGGGGTRYFPGTEIPGQPPTPGGFVILTGGARVADNTITIGNYQVYGGRGTSFNGNFNVHAIVADVTGY